MIWISITLSIGLTAMAIAVTFRTARLEQKLLLQEEQLKQQLQEERDRHARMRDLYIQGAIPKSLSCCGGCRNYHGVIYGGGSGAMLVCAIHPSGQPEGVKSCPDWEGDQ